ncbi:neuronal pentraxin-2-like [Oculina patagonica]
MALKGHTFKKAVVRAPYMCDFKCEQDVRCQSFNYVIQENVCELNNVTKEEKPEHFVRDPERFYIKRLSTAPRKDYAFQFLSDESYDFVQIGDLPDLTQFTVCLWMQSYNNTAGRPCVFSYAIPHMHNELLMFAKTSNTVIIINAESRKIPSSASDTKWHHICLTWENTEGLWKLYQDGEEKKQDKGFKTGHVIRSGGYLVLAQDQDKMGGRFQPNNVFRGLIGNVNVWDHVLSPSVINEMSKSCLAGEGNVYKWSDFLTGIKGNTRLVSPSPCKPLSGQ